MATPERRASRLALAGLASLVLTAACAHYDAGEWRAVPRALEPEVSAPVVDLPAECAARRARVVSALQGPGLLFLTSASGGHGATRFYQDDDFLYLTGVEEADIALLVAFDGDGQVTDEVLYLHPYDAGWEVWNGKRLNPGPQTASALGVSGTRPLPEGDWGDELAGYGAGTVYALEAIPGELGPGQTVDPESRLRRALDATRLVKSAYEIACLRNAIDITCVAVRNGIAEAHPGAWEYEVQGAIEGTYLRMGSERAGFPSICGTGPNTVTLHYDKNVRQMQAGELLLMDVGAKYRYYCADVSRTVPVDGRFTPRQREVYETVLRAQTAAAEAARPGMTIRDLDRIARKVISDAGYITEDENGFPRGEHFPHGVGHWIGLDVHDVGGRVPIPVGGLFTIEPGIYLEDEALGVRIEDDYLMTEEGAVKLSTGVPSDPDAIEALMATLG